MKKDKKMKNVSRETLSESVNKPEEEFEEMGAGMESMMGMPMGGKPKNMKAALGKFLKYLGVFKLPLLIALISTIVATVLHVISPQFVKELTNVVTEGIPSMTNLFPAIDMDEVVRLIVLLVVITAVAVVFEYAQGFIMATLSQRIGKRMRRDLTSKINRMPLKYFDTNSQGDTLSRMTNDVDRIANALNEGIMTLISSVVMVVGVLIMMFITNWQMALTAIGSTLLGFFLIGAIMGRSQKYFFAQQKHLGKINGHIEEIFSGLSVVKAYNGGDGAKEKFSAINGDLQKSAFKSQFLSGIMMPIMVFMGNFGYVMVCVVGAVLAINSGDPAMLGTIASFMIYIHLFTRPLGQIAQAGASLQSIAASSERVFEFLEEGEMANEADKTGNRLEKITGNVEFKHVKFGYDEGKTIIHDFSASVKAGSKVAIVGPTGAGKTTLVNLLMRFYEIWEGEILIDGVNTRQITRENIADIFGMVLQDTWIFGGTIAENIKFSKEGVSDEKVAEVCAAANLSHYVATLPNGYATELDEKVSLSAGQRQLITIARAMAEDAPMLILDEATSSVDTRTEILIQEAMDRLTKGRTTFVIAHRLSTIRNADLILVLKDGDIIESGNHDALIEQGGFYKELYNSQFTEV